MPRSIEEIVREQISRSYIAREAVGRAEEQWQAYECSTVTVSRELGSSGGEAARLAAEHLHWSFWDRNLVEAIAEDANVRTRVVEQFDERTVSELETLAHSLAGNYEMGNFMYRHHLARALLSISRIGHAVILGRGANLLLRNSLNIRVYASLGYRVHKLIERGLTAKEAEDAIERSDRERASFIRKVFGKDINDPTTYDLMIRTDHFGPDGAAELIVTGVAIRSQ